MTLKKIKILPCKKFWENTSHVLITEFREFSLDPNQQDFSHWKILLPEVSHADYLKKSMRTQMGGTLFSPRFSTIPAWLGDSSSFLNGHYPIKRLLRLYVELRQHISLKKLFTHHEYGLLSLSYSLLELVDELTKELFPKLCADTDLSLENMSEIFLEKISSQISDSGLISDELKLAWSIYSDKIGYANQVFVRCRQIKKSA